MVRRPGHCPGGWCVRECARLETPNALAPTAFSNADACWPRVVGSGGNRHNLRSGRTRRRQPRPCAQLDGTRLQRGRLAPTGPPHAAERPVRVCRSRHRKRARIAHHRGRAGTRAVPLARAGCRLAVQPENQLRRQAESDAGGGGTHWRGGRLCFHFCMWPERRPSLELVERARESGVEALIVTADTPVWPNSEYNKHNGFWLPMRISRRNALDLALRAAVVRARRRCGSAARQ